MRPIRIRRAGVALAMLLASLPLIFPVISSSATSAPAGVTAYALAGKVSLSWKASTGATSYKVLRGTSIGSITTVVASGVTTTTYTDATVANGTTYFYTVKSSAGGVDSGASVAVSATPRAASCSSGNAIQRENCFPGSAGWKLSNPTDAAHGGIEGFATANSVNHGASVDLKVNTANGVAYHIDVYRTGWYGGTQGRLVESLPGRAGVAQPSCNDDDTTGLIDCSNWAVTDTVTTSADWPTGVYLLRLMRDDSVHGDNYILLTVRDDGGTEAAYYGVPVSSYQAYNNYGGRSLYDYNSYSNGNTVAGTQRAVKVSYDRPYQEPIESNFNWYAHDDVRAVSWFERQGVDMSYGTSLDLPNGGLTSHRALIHGVHDEYWSAEMRSAVTAARNAGTSLFFLGANEVYWKIRFETNPYSGIANRVQVCYKSTQSGAADPVSPTGTWRDPAGANQPENALVGVMYTGDNDNGYFPMQVSASESQNRIWRSTDIYNVGGTLGNYLVGWEWDKRYNNGQEPAGVTTVATSPVNGELLQDAGKNYVQNANANVVAATYRAASGATVFATGTNHWARGLGFGDLASGEPNDDIQQATANILQDMNVRPTTPDGITLDAAGAPIVSSSSPAAGATSVNASADVSATFDRSLTASTVNASTFTLTDSGGNGVPASVSYDNTTFKATLNPTSALNAGATYTGRLTTGIKSSGGTAMAVTYTWQFTVSFGPTPHVISELPADTATGVSSGTSVSATFDIALDPTTISTSTFTLADPNGNGVTATVTYNSATKTATLAPSGTLVAGTQYTAQLSSAVTSSVGEPLGGVVTWTFTTAVAPQVSSKSPAAGASGISTATTVRATFDRALNPASVTTSSFTLTDGSGNPVAATVSYDAASTTAILTPTQALAGGPTFTAKLTTAITSSQGAAMASPVTWAFATAAPLQVSGHTPAPSAVGISPQAVVRAVFNNDVDPATVTTSTFKLTGQFGGPAIAATVTYDSASKTATLTPSSPLAVSTTYSATVTTGVTGSVGGVLATDDTWQFTTASSPPAPAGVTALDPASGATAADATSPVQATFDRALDPATVTPTSAYLTNSSGTVLAATVSYTAATTTITITPNATLASNAQFTGHLTSAIRAADGTPNSLFTWSFSTSACPCNLMGTTTPAGGSYPVQDGRTGAGPFSYELGTKIAVSQAVQLKSIRFYKDAGETGTHVGTLWSSTGTKLAQVTFSGETASGWQSQNLTTPYALQVGTTYVVSVGFNAFFSSTTSGLATQLTSGPLQSVADGQNGVFGNSAGTFPTGSWSSSNYFVDAVVKSNGGSAPAPQVTSTVPVNAATGVDPGTNVKATFSTALDASTVSGASFTLTPASGSAIAATVSYDVATQTATLTPSSPLSASTTYTAKLTTAVKSSQGTPLAAAYTWQFTVTSQAPPTVSSTVPANSATGVSPTGTVQATFSTALDATTVTTTTFKLATASGTAVGASVSYNAATRTATLTPSAALATGSGYTATLTTGVRGANGMAMASPYTWSFTTSGCPCNLMGATTPTGTHFSVADGRSGAGPFTYELGTKIAVTQSVQLKSIRFYKDAGETGTHVGALWSSTGTKLTQVTFSGESASGWQSQTLPTPYTLQVGQTYVVSVGFNAYFSSTAGGLATQLTNGPLQSVADGQNGVFGNSAGTFPTGSWNSSNYFVDPVVG